MVDLAERLGANHLVTGHYARIVEDGDGPLLAAAADEAKDQSYMLAGAAAGAARAGSRFPLTELTKPEVREIAARHGLAVASKPESQDLCFLAGQGKRGFLRRHGGLRDREGDVLDRCGRRRRRATAATTTSPSASAAGSASRPRSRSTSLATDAGANTVTVGTRGGAGDAHASASATRSCTATAPASTRSACATTRAPVPAARSAPSAAAATRRSSSSWARTSPAPRPARPRCCWPARRSSATARSPPRPDADAGAAADS